MYNTSKFNTGRFSRGEFSRTNYSRKAITQFGGFRQMADKWRDTREERILPPDFDFYEELTERCKVEPILPRMEELFTTEIRNKRCSHANFINIVERALDYHRHDFPQYVLNDVAKPFESEDRYYVDWQRFIEECKHQFDVSVNFEQMLGDMYQWMLYNRYFGFNQVFNCDEQEIDRLTFQETCKRAGTDLEPEQLSQIFDKYKNKDRDQIYLNFERVNDAFENMRPMFENKFRSKNVDKPMIFQALRDRLRMKRCTLRELFGVTNMTADDKVSQYEATRILVQELDMEDAESTDAINKFCINLLCTGSKSHISLK